MVGCIAHRMAAVTTVSDEKKGKSVLMTVLAL